MSIIVCRDVEWRHEILSTFQFFGGSLSLWLYFTCEKIIFLSLDLLTAIESLFICRAGSGVPYVWISYTLSFSYPYSVILSSSSFTLTQNDKGSDILSFWSLVLVARFVFDLFLAWFKNTIFISGSLANLIIWRRLGHKPISNLENKISFFL